MTQGNQFAARVRRWLGLVFLAYALRSVVALTLAWPLAHRLAPVNILALPRGDRELFAPGSRALIQTLAEQAPRLMKWWHWGWLWGSAVVFAGGVSAAFLLHALAQPPGTEVTVWLRKFRNALPAVLAVTIIQWLAFLGLITLGKTALPIVPAFVYPLFGEKGADAALLVLALAVAALAFLVFVIADLARAAAVAWPDGMQASLGLALQSFASRPQLCVAVAMGYFTASCVLPVGAEWLLPKTLTASSLGLATTVLIHQLVVAALCALHLFWWHTTLRVVCAPQQTKNNPLTLR